MNIYIYNYTMPLEKKKRFYPKYPSYTFSFHVCPRYYYYYYYYYYYLGMSTISIVFSSQDFLYKVHYTCIYIHTHTTKIPRF